MDETLEDVTVYYTNGYTQKYKGVTRRRALELENLISLPEVSRVDVVPAGTPLDK